MNLFGLRPAVMRRPLADMLRSLHDAALRQRGKGGPLLLVGEDDALLDAPPEVQKDHFVHVVAPWYLRFYASWILAERRGEVPPVLWLDFDCFRADEAGAAGELLAHNGIELPRTTLETAVVLARAEKERLRFHRGVPGRGEAWLTDEHRGHLERLAAGFPSVDFRAAGLL